MLDDADTSISTTRSFYFKRRFLGHSHRELDLFQENSQPEACTRSRTMSSVRLSWLTRLWLWAVFIINLLASLILIALSLTATTFVKKRITADDKGNCSACQYQPIKSSRPPDDWNEGLVLAGALIGGVSAAAFLTQELLLRQLAAASTVPEKQLGYFLRPFTRNWSNKTFYRVYAIAGLLLISSTVGSISIIFSAHSVHDRLVSGISVPLESMNRTFLYAQGDSLEMIANWPLHYDDLYPNDRLEIPAMMKTTSWYLELDHITQLEAFMYQSALIHTSKISGQEHPFTANITRAEFQGGFYLGDSVYLTTRTEGIGINVSSYEKFSGDGVYGLPRRFTFEYLMGELYADNVNVKCRDIRYQYEIRELRRRDIDHNGQDDSHGAREMIISHLDGVQKYRISRGSGGPEVLADFGLLPSSALSRTRGSEVIVESGSFLIPAQTIIIPVWNEDIPDALIARCEYQPAEYHKSFVVKGSKGPILSRHLNFAKRPDGSVELTPATFIDGKCLSPILALPAARAIHELLSPRGRRRGNSPLNRAFRELQDVPLAYSSLVPAIENVLAETAQAYFSLLRQRVERGNMWPGAERLTDPQTKAILMGFEISRYGGDSSSSRYSLIGIFMLAALLLVSLLRVCVVGGLLPFATNFLYTEAEVDAVSTVEKEGGGAGSETRIVNPKSNDR